MGFILETVEKMTFKKKFKESGKKQKTEVTQIFKNNGTSYFY